MRQGWKERFRRIGAGLLAVVCVAVSSAGWMTPMTVYGETGNCIVNNAFASNMSGQADKVQGTAKLTTGKRGIFIFG